MIEVTGNFYKAISILDNARTKFPNHPGVHLIWAASRWLRKTDSVWSTSRMVVGGVDEFAGVKNELKKLEENSIDYYAAIRSISRQKRRDEISNLNSGDAILPNFTVQVGDPINFEILSK